MAKDVAFLMYYKQWLVSTAGWDADERGWYINLLCHQADKPDGLPNDIETIAELAGVKISQFERFKLCWKRTLEAKFKATDKGTIVNEVLKDVIEERREYSEKQQLRGLIGYFVKHARHKFNINDEQANELYNALRQEDFLKKTKEERLMCYKHTLIALLGDVDVDGDVELKGGVGEKEKTQPKMFTPPPKKRNGKEHGVKFDESLTKVFFSDGSSQDLGKEQRELAEAGDLSPMGVWKGSQF